VFFEVTVSVGDENWEGKRKKGSVMCYECIEMILFLFSLVDFSC
jgi:hypothetical protein